MQKQDNLNKHKKTVIRLTLVTVLMFGFGFALVPLYDVFCDITGINGKTGGRYQASDITKVDKSRLITVQFTTTVNENMPWRFEPMTKSIEVHPGQRYTVYFYAENKSGNNMVGQAVPSISPGLSAQFFKKTECFCFNRQELASKESIEMPMVFMLDNLVPEQYKTITLSYTMFDAGKYAQTNKTTGTF